MNNQKQLSLALLQYEAATRRFPAYVDWVGNNPTSWIVALFPYLERTDLQRIWRDAAYGAPYNTSSNFTGRVYLKLMVCPSDPPESTSPGSTPLSYAVNCGLQDEQLQFPPGTGPTTLRETFADDYANLNPPQLVAPQATAVFHRKTVNATTLSVIEHVSSSVDYMSQHDGSSNTLMLSENVAADNWIDLNEWSVGFNWWPIHKSVKAPWSPDQPNLPPLPPSNQAGWRINENITWDRPRPSSYHTGGVVASFCDGHQYFLREDVAYFVFIHLCTPDSNLAAEYMLRDSQYLGQSLRTDVPLLRQPVDEAAF